MKGGMAINSSPDVFGVSAPSMRRCRVLYLLFLMKGTKRGVCGALGRRSGKRMENEARRQKFSSPEAAITRCQGRDAMDDSSRVKSFLHAIVTNLRVSTAFLEPQQGVKSPPTVHFFCISLSDLGSPKCPTNVLSSYRLRII